MPERPEKPFSEAFDAGLLVSGDADFRLDEVDPCGAEELCPLLPAVVVEGSANFDFSSPLEAAADALKTKPPLGGSLLELEELVAALLASGLKLDPANVKAAGGAGGATFAGSAADFDVLD